MVKSGAIGTTSLERALSNMWSGPTTDDVLPLFDSTKLPVFDCHRPELRTVWSHHQLWPLERTVWNRVLSHLKSGETAFTEFESQKVDMPSGLTVTSYRAIDTRFYSCLMNRASNHLGDSEDRVCVLITYCKKLKESACGRTNRANPVWMLTIMGWSRPFGRRVLEQKWFKLHRGRNEEHPHH